MSSAVEKVYDDLPFLAKPVEFVKRLCENIALLRRDQHAHERYEGEYRCDDDVSHALLALGFFF